MQDRTYILKWRQGVSPEIRWFLRGIRGDGSFYGELLSTWESSVVIDGNPAKGIGKTIEGVLSPTDCDRFGDLVVEIGSPGAELLEGWTGLLAEGPINAPIIRFYYVPGDEERSSVAARFLAVIELLEGYLRPYYPALTRAIPLMDVSAPTTWQCPTDWHADWNGPWQCDRLKELALAFNERSETNQVRLEIIEPGYVRVAFLRGEQQLGVAYVNHIAASQAVFQLYLGVDDDECKAGSVAEAVELIVNTRTTWQAKNE